MANKTPTISRVDPGAAGSPFLAAWVLANGDVGLPVDLFEYADRSIQFEGTFGAAGTVVFEGSNDGANFHTLHDHTGVALSFTTASIAGVSEVCRYVRARCTGGDGTTALVATLFARRTRSP